MRALRAAGKRLLRAHASLDHDGLDPNAEWAWAPPIHVHPKRNASGAPDAD